MKQDTVRWAPWFVVLWGVVAVTALVLMFFLPFKIWSIAAAVGFGTMEGVGLVREKDAFPPLTFLIRRYLPRWLAFAAIYALVGGAGAYWFRISRAERVAGMFALLGWLTAHFDLTYDEELPKLQRRPPKGSDSPESLSEVR